MPDVTMDRRPDPKGDRREGGKDEAGIGGTGTDGREGDHPDLRALLRELFTGLLGKLVEMLAARPGGSAGGQREDATGASVEPSGADDERGDQAQPATCRDGRYPYAHGDVDLSGLPANVPTAEERRPRRGAGARRYYFLPKDDVTEGGAGNRGDASAAAAPQPSAKPG